jgi:hypothetical protein
MKYRVNLLLFGFSLGLWLNGCQKHVKATVSYEVVHGQGYAYQRINEGEFVIGAVNRESLKKAQQEIGCGTKYICEIEPTGELYDVQVHEK